MMITYVKGNLLEDKAEALVNTVNTVGVMGKGIALAFKQAFPHNFRVYADACKTGTFGIGKILPVRDTNLLYGDKLIVNLPTKAHWRQPSEYEFVEAGLIALVDYLKANAVGSLALPALGCGNGGLRWDVVKPMIERYLEQFDIDIVVYEPL
ncbi:O-acetyl-ADP-ribose deacetylase (regulator of RNase III), contains Macro domain [Mucilaginibacter pineti]|uniref:O-acetyl-ADP-ribose deacetylase (Regulator of RNase III), contains Macro domain n=1 Tax=Mucilaginibacter pineti TaxID=1391627 RepID=A0A1G7C6R8_9SPHI|nr:macro domain-containing protein [Mucilaginibacter pineti]SDE34999.1 O-acetyl-ADP-ribose deacetylase (regulator of RNase III), contains Macro domain [Mucilaginibacter pineti]